MPAITDAASPAKEPDLFLPAIKSYLKSKMTPSGRAAAQRWVALGLSASGSPTYVPSAIPVGRLECQTLYKIYLKPRKRAVPPTRTHGSTTDDYARGATMPRGSGYLTNTYDRFAEYFFAHFDPDAVLQRPP